MPVLSFGHSHYWAGSGAAAATTVQAMYPAWQAAAITPCGLGALQLFWDRYLAYLRTRRGEH